MIPLTRAPGYRPSQASSHAPFLVSALSARDRFVISLAALAWVLTSVFFWVWFLAPAHRASGAGLVLNSLVIGFESVVLPLWFFFLVLRMKRPRESLPIPPLTVAIVVTKAPSEPWELVRTTLEAMLVQEFPLPYDVWLADERPTDDVILWCESRGVRMSTRDGAFGYHNSQWPRRARCKEGNLAFFYDHFGYRWYDVVAQLDADHVPAPDYLRRMVAPFADPSVGYVAAPSICDRNAASSWSARGRLYAEAALHGPAQAGASGEAPSCIGSHYAVRTRALHEIGGLGPELVEDFSTTLMLCAAGWRGVFALDAEAHGNGPDCVADCVTQDFQWARGMMRVLLTISLRHWRGLSSAAKLRLGFCQLWYPLYTLAMLGMVLLPAFALITRTPLVRVQIGSFYLHFLPVGLTLIVVLGWLRHRRMLRPADAPVLSWEAILFLLVRWPWAMIGCAHAVWQLLAGRDDRFKVTPKRREGEYRTLPSRILVPYLALSAISLLPALLIKDAGAARGYYLWSLVNGVIYLFVAVAVVSLHMYENREGAARSWRRAVTLRTASVVGVGAALAFGVVEHGPAAIAALVGSSSGEAAVAAVPPAPNPAVPAGSNRAASEVAVVDGTRIRFTRLAAKPPPEAAPVPAVPSWFGPPIAIGVTTRPLAENWFTPWTASALQSVEQFERDVGKHAEIVMWYADWQHSPPPSPAELNAIGARGSIPEITWEPWNATGPLRASQPRFSLSNIIAGRFDPYIRSWAVRLAHWGGPVRLRFAQEMDGNWYPWGQGVNGNLPGQFVQAWRHVHDIFTAAGATNVQWVWSPTHGAPEQLYPGPAYVDVLGLTCLNGGALFHQRWRSFAQTCGHTIQELHALAPGLPIELSETGTTNADGRAAAWIQSMFVYLARHPVVSDFIWFNLPKETDWRVESSRAGELTFTAGAASRGYR